MLTHTGGDTYAGYHVQVDEIVSSIKIVIPCTWWDMKATTYQLTIYFRICLQVPVGETNCPLCSTWRHLLAWDTIWLLEYQCWGSVTFWCGSGSRSGSPNPYLWLMDPDPTTFFKDFKDFIKKFLFIYFSYNLPIGTSSSDFKILC
jgi:hypothetical protein